MLKENRKKYMLGILSTVAILFVTGVSYAIWSMTLTQESTNVINTACFKINFIEENEITLQNTYPITDEESKKLTPYTFRVENICNTNATYQINLEELESDLKKLSKEYIKVSLNNEKGKILNTYETVEKTLNEAETSKKLTTGVLKAREEKTFELRLWMDEDTPAVSEAMNANFQSKITIIAVQKEGIPEVSIVASEKEDGITVDISTVENPKNETLTYFYQLNEEEEIESDNNTHTFTGLSDGKYKVSVRAETLDGIILEEKELEVTIAYEEVYVSSSGSDDRGNGSLESPYETLQPAYNKVKSGGNILLLSDITATSTTNMNIENKSVTLRSNGSETYTIFRGNNLTDSILNIESANTFTTTNIIFDGNNVPSEISILRIAENNTVANLNENTIIQNGVTNVSSRSGGIGVYNNATLNINGAVITNNKATSTTSTQGAGIIANNAIVNLNSGEISNNISSTSTPHSVGGGIHIYNSIFMMNGGSIKNNKSAEGAGFSSYNSDKNTTIIINGGEIISNAATKNGGGIYLGSDTTNYITTLIIKGGTILNNTAPTGANTYISNNRGKIIDER